MESIETELKFLFTRKDFKILYMYIKDNYQFISSNMQTNYYFDSIQKPLNNRFINIRIRFIKDKSEITLKVPIVESTTKTVQNSYEYNINICRHEANNYIKNGLTTEQLNDLFGSHFKDHNLIPFNMKCFGHLRTTRISYSIEDSLAPLLLDINQYLGTFDYELEWELKEIDIANRILKNIFNKLSISTASNLIPKRGRFFNRYFELK